MEESNVTFKGTVNGLTIIMKAEEDFDTVLESIEKKIESAGKFFKGASLWVKYRGKKLTKDEEAKILSLMVEKSGAEIRGIEEEAEENSSQADGQQKMQTKTGTKRFYFFKDLHEGITKFHKGTVRSGQLVNFDGNLVVIGDVNPGGELVASGNVIVMGSLRGMVHAGADGNKDAIVVALNLQPTQLRIADVITRSPDGKTARSNFIPELAYIKDEMVYIERYLPQR